MKKSSVLPIVGLCLPVAFIIVAGILVTGHRERERKALLAYYSTPYKPQLKVGRAEVPKVSEVGSGLFEVQARCVSTGGSRQSQWWVRGQLFDVSGKIPREIWNSQKAAQTLAHIMTYPGPFSVGGVNEEADFSWRFNRDNKGGFISERADKRKLKFVVEAVAIPIAVPEGKLGDHKISINEAKPFQIAMAKQQPNAKYLRESIVLKPSDDVKHQTQKTMP